MKTRKILKFYENEKEAQRDEEEKIQGRKMTTLKSRGRDAWKQFNKEFSRNSNVNIKGIQNSRNRYANSRRF